MIRHVYRVLFCLGLCIGMELVGPAALAEARHTQETTLVIVPARLRMVQLAMDLADMRPVVVLSYRGGVRAADPLLFVWANGAWQYVSPDDFRERRFVTEWPRQVVMIGDDQTLPALLEGAGAHQVVDLFAEIGNIGHVGDGLLEGVLNGLTVWERGACAAVPPASG